MNNEILVEISARAMQEMKCELSSWPDVETGGVLLGYNTGRKTIIIEATDPGYRNVIREKGKFAYDNDYVEYVATRISHLYDPPLRLVGVWHKHNHSFDPIFSEEDNSIHNRICDITKSECCSILFQKNTQNDNMYIMRVCIIQSNMDFVEINPQHIKYCKSGRALFCIEKDSNRLDAE